MDKLVISRPEAIKKPLKVYAHIRCSPENLSAIEGIAHQCNLNNHKVCDALLDFALKRVKLVERPLFDLELQDLEQDDEL